MKGPKLMVLGARGLVGRYVVNEGLKQELEVVALAHEDLDVRDAGRAVKILDHEKPDWVVNAAAICNFDRCEAEPELSREVNLEAPVQWAEFCRTRGIWMCQFSTDYLFDGAQQRPYDEEAVPRPMSVYARHKAELERTFSRYPDHLVARVAWVFGRGGATFMSRLPDLLKTRLEVAVAAGKQGSCLYAGYGASIVLKLARKGIGGLVNVVHSGETGWEKFAELCLARLRKRGQNPACTRIQPVPFQKMEILKPGRPSYSVLATGKLEGILGHALVPWEEGLEAFLEDCED